MEPQELEFNEYNFNRLKQQIENRKETFRQAMVLIDETYIKLRKSWKTIIYLNTVIIIQSFIIVYLCFGVH